MLNQAWWTHLAIFNISHRKRVRTLESFSAPNRSQSESEKNDTEEEECINQEETDEDQRKPKKSPTFQKTWLQDHPWLCYEKDAYVYQKLRMELKFTRGCRDEILLWNVFKYKAWSLILCLNMTRKKKVLTLITTFLVCITFLVLQGSGKKKCFCWLACMNVKKTVE